MKCRISFLVAGCCVAVTAATLALSGCLPPSATGAVLVAPDRPLRADAATRPSEKLAGAINDFGLQLLRATATTAGGNTIVSPASVHAALSMTANGASGQTDSQMRAVLRTGSMSSDETNRQWASLLGALDARSPRQTLEIANAMWALKGIAFKNAFLDADRDFFGAQVSTLDFQKDDVAGAINGWVSSNTHGMITRMVDQVPSDALLYLANAVYFKGDWVEPF
jgi:serine protease inhibitor